MRRWMDECVDGLAGCEKCSWQIRLNQLSAPPLLHSIIILLFDSHFSIFSFNHSSILPSTLLQSFFHSSSNPPSIILPFFLQPSFNHSSILPPTLLQSFFHSSSNPLLIILPFFLQSSFNHSSILPPTLLQSFFHFSFLSHSSHY